MLGLSAATRLLGTSGTLCSLKAEDSSKTIFLFCMPAGGLNNKSSMVGGPMIDSQSDYHLIFSMVSSPT